MADLDNDLSRRLSRLAAAVPASVTQLDPVHRRAVVARQSVRMAWLTPLAVLVVGTLAAAGMGIGPFGPDASRSPVPPEAAIHVRNDDDRRIEVVAGDRILATLRCGDSALILPELAAPGPPWNFDIRSAEGDLLRAVSLNGPLPQAVVVRDGAVLSGPWPVIGPPHTPCAPDPTEDAEGEVDTSRDGDFELVLRSDRSSYLPGEPINVSAALTYLGDAESVDITTDSGGPIMFGIREKLFGEIGVGGLSLLTCKGSTLVQAEPLVQEFQKSGGFSGEHPEASAFEAWFKDPDLRLPEGTWHLWASAGGPCLGGGPSFRVLAVIEIVVDDDAAATPGHPPATEYPFKPVYGGADIGSVVLQLKSERPIYETGSPIELAVDYWFADGPRLIASHFFPEVALSVVQLDAKNPEGRFTAYDSLCIDLGLVTGKERHIEIGPRLIADIRGDALPETNDELFVDGRLHLPVGRWRISASVAGTFGTCAEGGEPYELGTSLEIEVVETLY